MSELCLLAVWFLGLQVKKKTESVQLPGGSSSAEPGVVNDAFQRRMSHTGSQSIPPNCGGPVWLRYQPVRGMAGRQERIKRSCKEKRQDGSASLPAMKLFRCTGKQASPGNAWKPLNSGLILPVRSFLRFWFLPGP